MYLFTIKTLLSLILLLLADIPWCHLNGSGKKASKIIGVFSCHLEVQSYKVFSQTAALSAITSIYLTNAASYLDLSQTRLHFLFTLWCDLQLHRRTV